MNSFNFVASGDEMRMLTFSIEIWSSVDMPKDLAHTTGANWVENKRLNLSIDPIIAKFGKYRADEYAVSVWMCPDCNRMN